MSVKAVYICLFGARGTRGGIWVREFRPAKLWVVEALTRYVPPAFGRDEDPEERRRRSDKKRTAACGQKACGSGHRQAEGHTNLGCVNRRIIKANGEQKRTRGLSCEGRRRLVPATAIVRALRSLIRFAVFVFLVTAACHIIAFAHYARPFVSKALTASSSRWKWKQKPNPDPG